MLFLCIETSGTHGSLALYSGRASQREVFFPEGLVHGREIAARLADALREEGKAAGALEAIAVSVGPGSFTGLRVGVVAAKTLAFALRIPVVAESSLKVIAGNVLASSEWDRKSTVLPVLDARQGAYFAAAFEVSPDASPGGGGLVRSLSDGAYRPEEILASLESAGPQADRATGSVLVIGEGADSFLGALDVSREGADASGPMAASLVRGPRDWDRPRAGVLGLLSAERAAEATFELASIHGLEPAYLRLADAERKFLSRKNT